MVSLPKKSRLKQPAAKKQAHDQHAALHAPPVALGDPGEDAGNDPGSQGQVENQRGDLDFIKVEPDALHERSLGENDGKADRFKEDKRAVLEALLEGWKEGGLLFVLLVVFFSVEKSAQEDQAAQQDAGRDQEGTEKGDPGHIAHFWFDCALYAQRDDNGEDHK
jgi:hypothetical protein